MICDNLSTDKDGFLRFSDVSVSDMAKKYGTPLYLMDEDKIREHCRMYDRAVKKAFGGDAMTLFASKAASFKHIYRIMQEENIGIDVVSLGEIYTAKEAGFHLENAYFHGNNKTDGDISAALDYGIGYFVADGMDELFAIDRICEEKGKKANVLLRITPGIDPHTYEAVATGKVDSKFGMSVETGLAGEFVKTALSLPRLNVRGFHAHVGSQVFDSDVFLRTIDILIDFAADMSKKYGFSLDALDLGGGYGVRYTESDPVIDIEENILSVGDALRKKCADTGIKMPSVRLEPGRSIVADAGLTVYTVGSVKKIPGYKNYVSVDGGMADNPRFALYKSKYTVCMPEKMNASNDFECSVVGRCCESGDIIQENVLIPSDVKRGDLLCVLTTGAYNFSMSSSYNRLTRPPVVMIRGGNDFVAVKRETEAELLRDDI